MPVPDNSKDQSLSDDQYIRMGMGSYDRPWTAMDLSKAAELLSEIAKQGNERLPRFKSQRSGEVFARITSSSNLDRIKDKSMPIDLRVQEVFAYYRASNEICKIYYIAFSRNEIPDTEIIQVTGSMLRASALFVNTTIEFTPTLKKEDPSYESRMKGLEIMKGGLAMMVTTGLDMLVDKNFRAEERLKLLGFMEETYPPIVPFLLPASRTEVVARIEKMQQNSSVKDMQPGLKELLSKVTKSPQQAPSP